MSSACAAKTISQPVPIVRDGGGRGFGASGRRRERLSLCSSWGRCSNPKCSGLHGVDDDEREKSEMTAAEGEEQVETPQQLPTPYTTTRSEVLEHRCTHFPF